MMTMQITFKNFDHTLGLDSTLKRKTEKLQKFLKDDAVIQWVGEVGRDGHSLALKIFNHGQGDFFVVAKDKNLYLTMDRAISKMKHLLHNARRLRKERAHFLRRTHKEHLPLQSS